MTALQGLRVVQEDMGTDAVTFEVAEEGVTYLFISPNQSFESAIKSVLKVCRDLTPAQAQDIVREHCPDIKPMNERLGADHPPVPRFEAAPAPDVLPPAVDKGAHRRPRPPRWARIAAVAAPALVGGALLAQAFQFAGRAGDQSGSSGQGQTVSQADAPSVFDDPTFQQYVNGGNVHCDSVGPYAARCVDEDGQVMLSEASVGDSAVFTFSYGSDNIAFRIFEDGAEAEQWAAEDGNRKLYNNLHVVGRVALWGTDQNRLSEWSDSLAMQSMDNTSAMGPAAPIALSSPFGVLPERLAVLAFGTLGVTEETFSGATPPNVYVAQTLRGVELVMGIQDPATDGTSSYGPFDAVAVAADVNRPSEWGDDGMSTNGGESALPVLPDVVAVSLPTRPTTPPPSDPVTEEPPTPASEPVAEEPPAPASEPVTEEPPAPAEDDATPRSPEQPPTEETAEPTPEEPAVEAPAEPIVPQPEPVGEGTAEPSTPPAEGTVPPDADPAPDRPSGDGQGQEHGQGQGDEGRGHDEDHGRGEGRGQDAETIPAPPAEEEPESGLSLETLPTAWAA